MLETMRGVLISHLIYIKTFKIIYYYSPVEMGTMRLRKVKIISQKLWDERGKAVRTGALCHLTGADRCCQGLELALGAGVLYLFPWPAFPQRLPWEARSFLRNVLAERAFSWPVHLIRDPRISLAPTCHPA